MFTFPSINFPPFFAKCTKFCFPILGKNFFPSSNKRERKKVAGKKSFLCCAFQTIKVVSIWKKNTQNKLILFNTLKTMFHALQTSTYFLLTFLVNIFLQTMVTVTIRIPDMFGIQMGKGCPVAELQQRATKRVHS